MKAKARQTLEWMAERSNNSATAASIAEWLDLSVPEEQGALAFLRREGFVAYHEGDPGVWSITRRGLREVRFDVESNAPRYLMALESIANMGDGGWEAAKRMKSVASLALKTPGL